MTTRKSLKYFFLSFFIITRSFSQDGRDCDSLIKTLSLVKNDNLKKAKYPIIVKPNDRSLSKGITILRKFDVKRLQTAISRATEYSDVIIAQEYLSGLEYRVVAVENEIVFILKKFKSPRKPVEISVSSSPDFNSIVYNSMKHFGATVCGFDFMVNKNSIKVLEINSNPFIFQIKDYLSDETLERYYSKLEQLLRRN